MQLLLKHCFARAARINSVMYSDLVVTWCLRMREYERNHQTFGTWLDPDPDLLAALHPQKIPHCGFIPSTKKEVVLLPDPANMLAFLLGTCESTSSTNLALVQIASRTNLPSKVRKSKPSS